MTDYTPTEEPKTYLNSFNFRPSKEDFDKKELWKKEAYDKIREVIPQNDSLGNSLLRAIRTILDIDSERNNVDRGLESNKLKEQLLHEWELSNAS